jgi:GT2 family glycosyltransferase
MAPGSMLAEIEAKPAGDARGRTPARASADPSLPRIAVVIVTWNRREWVSGVLGALWRQTYPAANLDVVIVDNASSDGTLEHLSEAWSPDLIVDNATPRAHEPNFAERHACDRAGGSNRAGFASLTIVRNSDNHGGCGGFNTGFAFVERFLHGGGGSLAATRPDYVWLLDDDIDVAEWTASSLVRVAEADRTIGLVGARTMDLGDRETTIETTVYFDPETGVMGDEPAPGHRLRASHMAWASTVGGPKYGSGYAGVREVDVVSACCMLARWNAVKKVGFWDWRYFIYCDDADWCLRFAREGYRVVHNLDAVVYHTPWHYKLTPARLYYAQRNGVWMLQKTLSGSALRRATRRRMRTILKEGLVCVFRRRMTHAALSFRTVEDVVGGVAGKLDFPMPRQEETVAALGRIGALQHGAKIAVLIDNEEQLCAAEAMRACVRAEREGPNVGASLAAGAARDGRDEPRWVYIMHNAIERAEDREFAEIGSVRPERIVVSRRRRSMVRRQIPLWRDPPAAVVVFDQFNMMPLLTGRWNVHVEAKNVGSCTVERDGWEEKLSLLKRGARALVAAEKYARNVRPAPRGAKYG